MIVSTWQFLQKQVLGGSIGRVAQGVKTRRCAKKLLSEANHRKDPAQITFSELLCFNVIRVFRGRSLFVCIRPARRSAPRRCPFVVTKIAWFFVLPPLAGAA
jgi:hypothetical protein